MPELSIPQQLPDADASPDEPPAEGARLSLKLRRNLAALSVVGVALVNLPAVQLLRYQSAELQALAAGRAQLDPVARAVQVQRGLLAHRDISAQVLGGLVRLEAERQQRQNEVQSRLAALAVTLAEGRWELAIGEAEELHQDWLQLVRKLAARSIDSAGSDRDHRLLIEQTLQVIDLVGNAVQAEGISGVPAATLAAVHRLPRLIWQTSLLAETADPTTARLDDVERRLARTLGHLAGAPATSAVDAPLQQAVADAGASTERYFELLRGPTAPAERQATRLAALQAQLRLFDLAQARAVTQLASRGRAVGHQQALLFGGMGALGLLALALLAGIWRHLLPRQNSATALSAGPQAKRMAELAPGDGPERQAQSDGLMQRLRQAPAQASAPAPAEAAPLARSDPEG